MKKMAKIIGIIGGAVAILWAMRDRFISVATSREPEAPVFRAVRPTDPSPGIGSRTSCSSVCSCWHR